MLTGVARRIIFGYNKTMTAEGPSPPPLTPEQIGTFLRDGILVVDDLLGPERIIEAHRGLARTLKEECDVDVHDLEGTGCNLARVSSTNGAGMLYCVSSSVLLL